MDTKVKSTWKSLPIMTSSHDVYIHKSPGIALLEKGVHLESGEEKGHKRKLEL